MLEVTIDLDWADQRYQFIKDVADYRTKNSQKLSLTLSNDVKLEGHPKNLRDFAAQIIEACDTYYPLDVAAAS